MNRLLCLTLVLLVIVSACDKTPRGIGLINKEEPAPPAPLPSSGEEGKKDEPDTPPTPPQTNKVFTKADFKAEMVQNGVLTLPSEYTEIEASAFKGRNDINKLIAEGVTKVGASSFERCLSLRALQLPKVKHIDAKAFYDCKGLIRLDLPQLEVVGVNAFNGCEQIRELILPSLKRLETQAFYALLQLAVVELGESVPFAAADAFKFCTIMKRLKVPVGKQADFTAFANAHRFLEIEGGATLQANYSPLPDGLRVNGETIVRYEESGNTRLIDLVISPKYTKVATRAFWDVSALHGMFASNGLREVEDYGLADCPNIQMIDLPQLRRLGRNALEGCSRLEYVSLPKVEELGDNAMERCYSVETLSFPNLKRLGNSALTSCQRLKTLRLGATPPTMGNNVFGHPGGQYGIQVGQITLIVPNGAKAAYETWRKPYSQIAKVIEQD